jgi:hypothetical protein
MGPDEVRAVVVRAVSVSGQLLDTAGNVVRIVGNTFDPRASSGDGSLDLMALLQQTTAELARASASPGSQEAAFYRLFAPAQALLTALGDGLPPVAEALEPVIDQLARSVRELVEASAPLLPATAGLAAGLLLTLIPLLDATAHVLRESAPELQRIADALVAALAPFLPLPAALLDRGAAAGAELAQDLLPPIADLTVALAEAVVALQPLISTSGTLLAEALLRLQPLGLTLAGGTGRLARALAVRITAAIAPAPASDQPAVVVSLRPA